MGYLIHADNSLTEIGVVQAFTRFTASINTNCQLSDNTFQLDLPLSSWKVNKILKDEYIYIPDTEFGGVVSSVRKDTVTGTVTIKGINWRGLLTKLIIEPPEGEAYKVFTNTNANTMIQSIAEDYAGGLFFADPTQTAGLVSYQFRYQDALTGITKALNTIGYTMRCAYSQDEKKCELFAVAAYDLSESADISADAGARLVITDGRVDSYNHVIALGRGELAERTVKNLWYYNGTVTIGDRPAGLDESDVRTRVFDYPSAESENELIKSATEALLQSVPGTVAEVDLLESELELDDKILVFDRDLNTSSVKTVTSRTLTIDARGTRIETGVE